MDSVNHASHKMLLERAIAVANSRGQQAQIPDAAPPAYTAEPEDISSESDIDDEEEAEDPSPVTLTLNAGTHVQGQGNMIATPPLADATRMATLLLAAVQGLNDVKTQASEDGAKTPLLQVNLIINCGVTVNGDRNVVGYKTQGVLSTNKRKASEEDSEGVPEVKKLRAE